jgi:tripartite ATP-independent transporter DctM subunit
LYLHPGGMQATMFMLGSYPYSYSAVYELAVIPLFVLMGNAAAVSGMGRDLFSSAFAWVGHWRGGLSSATIVACAGFAALSGSSVAAAVTMGRVCLPEMRRYNYDPRLATGVVAAGGTLGILIPPSTAFIVYAILTEQSIGRLLLAGVLPGLLLTFLFIVTIAIWTRINPELGPAGPKGQLERANEDDGAGRPHGDDRSRQHRRHLFRRVHARRGGRSRRFPRAALGALQGFPRTAKICSSCCWRRSRSPHLCSSY